MLLFEKVICWDTKEKELTVKKYIFKLLWGLIYWLKPSLLNPVVEFVVENKNIYFVKQSILTIFFILHDEVAILPN